ncbi:MAG: hypothetical protein ACO1NQ_02350 [Flavobacteriales bacterium]
MKNATPISPQSAPGSEGPKEDNTPSGGELSLTKEAQALIDLVTAAAVNKRLLMRILAHLERKDLVVIHEEVAALDAEFRSTVRAGVQGPDGQDPKPERPVKEGALPVGREEERRGHALPNADEVADGTTGNVIGRDDRSRPPQATPATEVA